MLEMDMETGRGMSCVCVCEWKRCEQNTQGTKNQKKKEKINNAKISLFKRAIEDERETNVITHNKQ